MQNSKGASRAERPKRVDDVADIPMEKGTGISAQNQELLVANHSHNQADKSSSRLDCFGASENRADKPWGSCRRDSFPFNWFQNDPKLKKMERSNRVL